MKQAILLVLLSLSSSYSKSCFLSCGAFDNCNNSKCVDNQCGKASKNLNLAFTVEECPTEDDLCIYREFLLEDGTQSIEIPGGCLLTYQRSSKDVTFLFNSGVNLFACEDNFCNPPPGVTGCSQILAQERRDGTGSECEIGNGDKLDDIFGDSTFLHDLVDGVVDRRGFCINRNDFQEFKEDADCFGLVGEDLDEASECESLEDLTEIFVTTCEACSTGEVADCDVDQVTPPPTEQPTSSPTQSPTELPTLSPTQLPTTNRTDEETTPGVEEEDSDGVLDNPAFTAGVAALSGVGVCVLLGVLVFMFVVKPRRRDNKNEYVVPQEDVVIIRQRDVLAFKSGEAEEEAVPGVEILESTLDEVVVSKEEERDSDEESLDVARVMEELL